MPEAKTTDPKPTKAKEDTEDFETSAEPGEPSLDEYRKRLAEINKLVLWRLWSGESKAKDSDVFRITRDWLSKDVPGPSLAESFATQIKLRPRLGELELEINKLKKEIGEKAKALLDQTHNARQKEERLRELEVKFQALSEKQSLSHLLTRVGPSAQQKLLDSPEFRALFDRETPCLAYVLSIDIRRSTELMLKAREPKLFAEFITSLASQLRSVVLEHYGIFDKFTGDGILAFFPEFYSGSDAGYFAMKAASSCHQIFAEHYEKNRHCFTSVLKEVGLGVGLDYGLVQIVQIGGDFTVVGTPVVYACRMGGAKARHTYLNQPAFEQLFEKYSSVCDFEESEIEIKHEGKNLAYSAELNGKGYSPSTPGWNTPSEGVTVSETPPKPKDSKR